MRSRWTDFLTTDGEKPSRNRDTEFIDPPSTREALLKDWEEGWACVFQALEPLTETDLKRTVSIRGEAHSVMQAINRQLAHYPHHVGQIVLLARHFAGERLADAECATQPVGRVQSECGRRQGQPAIDIHLSNDLKFLPRQIADGTYSSSSKISEVYPHNAQTRNSAGKDAEPSFMSSSTNSMASRMSCA